MRTIVVGNEKGGSGKSTAAVHLVVGLLGLGLRVAALDVDSRQQTMTRFFANRAAYGRAHKLALPAPALETFMPAGNEVPLAERLAALAENRDAAVIDSPGSDTALSRAAHSRADVLVTPVNDSFVDLDSLAEIDPETFSVARPGRYSEMVWGYKKTRAARDPAGIDWIVMRNRLSHLDARNKRLVGAALEQLAPRVGCRLVAGFAERVIYRELFPRGLTVLDLGAAGIRMTMSHVGARSEVRGLLEAALGGGAPGRAAPARRAR